MAHIRKEVVIDADPDAVWAALADWGALHERLVPGFATDTELNEDGDRIITFGNGFSVREVMVAIDADQRRLAWSIVDGPYTHHNGVGQVFAEPGGGARFVWTTDLLPDEAAAMTAEMMEQGLGVAKQTLEQAAPAGA